MARRTISIDERIEKQTEVVTKAKEKYDEAVNELERLLACRDDVYREEILKAFEHSGRSYKEVMDFLQAKPGKQKNKV